MSELINKQDAIELLRNRLIESAINNVGIKCDAGQTIESVSRRIENWLDELPTFRWKWGKEHEQLNKPTGGD